MKASDEITEEQSRQASLQSRELSCMPNDWLGFILSDAFRYRKCLQRILPLSQQQQKRLVLKRPRNSEGNIRYGCMHSAEDRMLVL